MPATYLTEDDVRSLISMRDALEVTERAFAHVANGAAEIMPRERLRTDTVMLHALAGVDRQLGQLGWKMYTTTRSAARFLVGIYDGHEGNLVGLIEADFLGQLRTGAATGIATQYLATPTSKTLGIFGTGLQARTQAWAVDETCDLETIYVYGRDEQRRSDFAQLLRDDLEIEVIPAESPDQVVAESEILITATTSRTPVFEGSQLKPGTHVNAIGSNFLKKSELDIETFRRADMVVCDSREQCRSEAGDFVEPLDQGVLSWDTIWELSDVVRGHVKRADTDHITLFKSVGLGIQDVALGTLAIERARETGRGQTLPF